MQFSCINSKESKTFLYSHIVLALNIFILFFYTDFFQAVIDISILLLKNLQKINKRAKYSI